ncbi:MAG: radical SAM protein [Candidatus Schekmanbacteria bacterium]|nr:MAG: radical SAM protein [Candidatus Schekmanbacteria bacterium]
MKSKKDTELYPVFEDGVYLKYLEEPAVYNIKNDELYEINEEALDFLKKCNGLNPLSNLQYDEEFLSYCIDEKLISLKEKKEKHFQSQPIKKPTLPSLRYLELQITDRCNLKCKHCYLGNPKKRDLKIGIIESLFDQFEEIQGLRMIISGGEPLLHPRFEEINELLKDRSFRAILLTNGTLLDEDLIARINVQEYQISIDGLEEAHNFLRGRGTFKKSMQSVEMLLKKGIDVSIATMANKKNANDFPAMEKIFRDMGIKEWSVDVPVSLGYATTYSSSILLSPKEAYKYLNFGFGGGLYNSSEGYACGAHLCAVTPNADVCKCGFYYDSPSGNLEKKSLKECWEKIEKIRIDEIECRNCKVVNECRGGCRYRASMEGSEKGTDIVKCFFYGVKNP